MVEQLKRILATVSAAPQAVIASLVGLLKRTPAQGSKTSTQPNPTVEVEMAPTSEAGSVGLLRRILAKRSRISTQLYLAVGVAVALTVAASLVGWFSFNRVGDAQSQVNEGSVPELAAAFEVAQYGSTLVAAAPSLTVATTPDELAMASANIDQAFLSFEEQIAILEESERAGKERVEAIRAHAESLTSNIDDLKSGMTEVFQLQEERQNLQAELADLRNELDDLLVPVIDNQLFYVLTGYVNIFSPSTLRRAHLSEAQVTRYRRLAEMQADTNLSIELLANAFALSDESFIEPLRERFEAAVDRIDRNLEAQRTLEFYDVATPVYDKLFEFGLRESSIFNVFARELQIVERQGELLALNRNISVDLVEEVDGLVSAAQASADSATEASTQAILTGRTLLLAISGVSIIGASLIIWLFIGRVLLRRLGMLSDWMRRMAGGDLEAKVEIKGKDEVADMAAALEVFRLHALEALRLNEVEKLANQLQDKNEELEGVLAQLRKAQDQIVMREKLAALGELTAGVAHEIRNPLNFVNNFSEASGELIEELNEILQEKGVTLTDEQRGMIEGITGDLTSNVTRIRSHGERANRIVQDMLRMGRDSGDWQATDINGLLEQHARLAYHSARGTNQEFRVEIKEEFDPEVGRLEVIPQQLGRVFLNIVSNACYATDQRRRAALQANEEFAPVLSLSTERKDNGVEVHIRDNGTGMPPDVVEKMFNPFFTTKPTDQGTGLGLAISSDIVRRHGGAIRVESEQGVGTTMTVALPLERPPDTVEEPGRMAAPEPA